VPISLNNKKNFTSMYKPTFEGFQIFTPLATQTFVLR